MAHLSIWPNEFSRQNCPLPIEVQRYIRKAFWPNSTSSIAEYDKYFKYFQWTISVLSWPHGIVDTSQFAAQTYADLVNIVTSMKLMSDFSRLSIAQELQTDFPSSSQEQILRSMDLAARLWLTLHVRSEDFPVGPSLSDMTETSWAAASSLKGIIRETFPTNPYSSNNSNTRIDPSFTVVRLHKICRIKIHWTANLRDHLSFNRSTSTLFFFPHKICLISHLESCDILPKDFVAETIRTFDLLAPFGDESTQKFLDETRQSFYRTSYRDLPRATDLEEFRYWRKRLTELHDVYNEAPRSVLQIWHDRRNPLQWWTFWLAVAIAVMTIIFGIITSYTGFRQVNIAQKSFDLALAQACSQSNLPEFCTK